VKTGLQGLVKHTVAPFVNEVGKLPNTIKKEVDKGAKNFLGEINKVGKKIDEFGGLIKKEADKAGNTIKGVAKGAIDTVLVPIKNTAEDIGKHIAKAAIDIHNSVEKIMDPTLVRSDKIERADGKIQWFDYKTLYNDAYCTSNGGKFTGIKTS
jgi:hypothetical protein